MSESYSMRTVMERVRVHACSKFAMDGLMKIARASGNGLMKIARASGSEEAISRESNGCEQTGMQLPLTILTSLTKSG